MFSAGRCVFWCPLAGAESDFCGRNGGWKGLVFRHNRVLVQNQGTVLKKSSHRGVHPGHFPSREGPNERQPISCAHSSWIKKSTLLCRKMTWVHPVVSFPLIFICFAPLHVYPCPCNVRISTEYLYSEHALKVRWMHSHPTAGKINSNHAPKSLCCCSTVQERLRSV